MSMCWGGHNTVLEGALLRLPLEGGGLRRCRAARSNDVTSKKKKTGTKKDKKMHRREKEENTRRKRGRNFCEILKSTTKRWPSADSEKKKV